MRGLISWAIKHDKAVILMLLAIFLFGIMSYRSLPKEENPDIQIPILYIPLILQGISPEDSERLLVKPLERKLKSIEGIDELKCYAFEGGANVIMEFQSNIDIKKAINDVRAQVDEAIPEMPENLRDITVKEVNLSLFPVLNIILTGDSINDRELKKIAKNLKDRIETIPEVLSATINGDREEVIEINVSQKILDVYQINFYEIAQILYKNNVLIQAGALSTDTGNFSIKVSGMFNNVDDIKNTPIKVNGNNILKIKDIGEVRETYKDYETIARVNGKKAMVIEVSKRTGTNIMTTIDEVKKIVEEEKTFISKNVNVVYSQDSSNRITDMISELLNSIFIAVIIVFFVIAYELGFRSALLVSVAIPGSFFAGIIIISMMKLTINIMVLFSLILAIGMLVDAAIVVTEYADRKMIDGIPRLEAYKESAIHMFWPSVAASLTTKIVFLPLLFWPGTTGKFMKYMPLTLVSTLIGSLFMALIFIPVLGSYFGKPKELSQKEIENVKAIENGEFDKLEGITKKYHNALDYALKKPKTTIYSIFGLLFIIIILFGFLNAGFEFFPDVESDNATVDIRARGNLSIDEKNRILREVESKILDMNQYIKIFYSKIGLVGRTVINSDMIGRIYLEFGDWKSRPKVNVVLDEIKNRLKDVPGIIVEANKENKGPSSGKDVQIQLSSRNPDLLTDGVEKILKYMKDIGGFVDIDDGKPLPMIDYQLKIDRERAALNGVDVASLNSVIPLLTNGVILSKFRGDKYDEEIDIIARFNRDERDIMKLQTLNVVTQNGIVPITNFVEIVPIEKVASIERNNGMRSRMIQANVAEGFVANNLTKAITNAKNRDSEWNNDVIVSFKGQEKDMRETQTFLKNAFGSAIIGMIITLVLQFNQIFMAFVILTAVFFSFIGVLLALVITMQPFGVVMCGVGIITLAGIVVNNNILLIDAYLTLLKQGVERFKAIEQAAVSRLRPILLTSVTTSIGLLPMVFSMSINLMKLEVDFGAPSSQWWVQLSTSIAGGVLFATILTLFFTPAVLTLHAKFLVSRSSRSN
jgi:multidrug efflux pump